MTAPEPAYEPRRFRSTVPFYARYRLGYPHALIRRVVERAGLTAGDAVMDLGCGPGLLAIPFAKEAMAVTAVDPEPEMIAAAGAAAAEAGVTLALLQASSFDLPAGIGPFGLVAMGRSFHWMERSETLRILDGLVAPGGAIALFHDEHPRTVENGWRDLLHEIADTYGRDRASHIQARESTRHRSHESVLLDSAFARLERVGVVIRRALSADDIVGLALSLSTTSPEKLGDRRVAFEADLRAGLARLSPEGRFTEIAELSALIAWR